MKSLIKASIDVHQISENIRYITTDQTLTEKDRVYFLTLDINLDKLALTDKSNSQFAQSSDEAANQNKKDTHK